MWASQVAARSEVHKLRRLQLEQQSENLNQVLPDPQKWAMELASEEGASTWLANPPVENSDSPCIRTLFMTLSF